jgi:hypothetical protein
LEANLIVPVPLSASTIRRLGVVEGREGAFSILEIISFEAS